jgi:serine/threonine-protein kinase
MELIEGPTLADRIAQGAIPVEEAMAIARQIAAALEAAHEHGTVHRDLKPSNVKLRADGTVKVLDFGLAKAVEPVRFDGRPGAATLADSPTITSPAVTGWGVILGTAAYMSPEQARGRAIDRRTDVWALGCVIFEMLTGRPAFPGSDVAETLGRVMHGEPAWSELPPGIPPVVTRFLRRCLEKNPEQRVRDVGDLRLALEGAFEPPALPTPVRSRGNLLPVASALVLGAIAGAGTTWLSRPAATPAVSRLSHLLQSCELPPPISQTLHAACRTKDQARTKG